MARREYYHAPKGLPGIPLKYIESTGTQWIVTDFVPKQAFDMELDYQILQQKNSELLSSGGKTTGAFMINNDSDKSISLWNNRWSDIFYPTTDITQRQIYKISNKTFSIGDEVLGKYRFTYISSNTGTLNIFYKAREWASPAKGRFFGLRISGAYTHNYIPLLLTENFGGFNFGEVGIYDTAEDKFFGNAGTGKFLAGPPAEWDELEYIETNGNSYIDTGIPLLNQYNTIIKFRFLAYKSNAWLGYLWGNYNSKNWSHLVGLYSGEISIMWGIDSSSYITKIPFDNDVHTAYVFKTSMGFDDNPRENKYAEIPSPLLYERNYILGNLIHLGSISASSAAKNCCLYGWQALNDDNIIQADFIPCRATSSILGMNEGDVGMWDKVSATLKKSATNDQFLAGPKVILL